MNRSLHRLETRITEVLRVVGNCPTPLAQSLQPCLQPYPCAGPSALGITPQYNENTDVPQHTLPESTISSPASRTVTIHFDGIGTLTFDPTTVPDPPPITFADDLDQLFTEWYNSRRLVVAGHGIPIRHWDRLYLKKSKVKADAWVSYRTRWSNWKVSDFEAV